MSIPMTKIHLRSVLILGALFVILGAALAGASQNAIQSDFDDDPDAMIRELLKHRREEAETKQRLTELIFQSERERTVNQEQYDVHYYDLEMDLNPSTNILTGTLEATVEVIGDPISTLDLDLRFNMNVSAATAGGSAATWSHDGDIVTVDLDQTYVTGETVTVSVDYSGNPAGGAFGWDWYGGQNMIWTLSEPYGARTWWPCKDLNSDKADSMDIRVTVPDHLIVASNGRLMSDIDHGDTRSFHWKTNYPIATYLVSLAIHPYTVWSDWYTPLDNGDPMEVVHYVFPDVYGESQENFGKTVDMLEVFAQGFGEYPFVEEKYGHAMFNWGGGMEHQTITSMGGWWEDIISHELAHQWFGDFITCDDFHHIWLNEGFAVWCEAYWKEMTEGFEIYQLYMDGAAYYGSGTIIVEDPYNDNIFDHNLTYNKASWVVHMLRGILGDEDFFAALDLYQDLYGYDSATTEEFQDIAETVSGLDLEQFFQQWIYGEYFPVYFYTWSQGEGTAEVSVDQVQENTGLFTMPLDIRVITDTGTYDFTVQNSDAHHDYSLPVDGVIESVLLDPEKWILRQIQTVVSNPSFDSGILLVNGVHWDTYGSEIYDAYEAEAFWGDNVITFWDNFPEPDGGYPSTLPPPLGHGPVPADVIGNYSSVIWVGNNYNGDLPKWQETPIQSYLEVGGNVLLMTRQGMSFLEGDLADYLGINWSGDGLSLYNYVAQYMGLIDIAFTGSQTYIDVFSPTVGPNSTLLFKDVTINRGVGVHAQPPGGGSERPEGARFIYMAGRPYRMDHADLRQNIEFILEHFFSEPWTTTATPDNPVAARPRLETNFPNPFNPHTTIPFSLPSAGQAELAIYDVGGRLVKVLLSGEQSAGEQSVVWEGVDGEGRPASSGVYFARLSAAGETITKSMVLLR